MLKSIYLIRHGRTEGSGERRYKGSIDVPLDATGERQATLTARLMERMGLSPDVIYTSPLSRARRTAELIGQRFPGVEIKAHPELRERHFGVWEGMTFAEIDARWPDAFRAWAGDPLRHSPMEGESTLEVTERVVRALGDIESGNHSRRVAVVAHGGVNRSVLCHYTGLPLENIFRIEQDFACLNVINFYDGLPVLEVMNITGERMLGAD